MLTRREVEVMKLRKEGNTQVDIAKILNISQAAVSGFERSTIKKVKEAQATIKKAKKVGLEVEDEEF